MSFDRTSSFSLEWVTAIAIGFAAGITSTVLTGWAPLSNLGRAIVFVGSCMSGATFAFWASRSSSAPRAMGTSALAGALQANISGTLLVLLAIKTDVALHTTPALAPPNDPAGLAVLMLIAGSIVGTFVGMVYGIVPSLVARWRQSPRLGTLDRTLLACAAFLAAIAGLHSCIVSEGAASVPLAVLAVILAIAASVRIVTRAIFLARVRSGEEPRYRIEPTETGLTLMRIADEDPRETMYRENAMPSPEPIVIGVL
jgi:hypothetical protein